MRNSGKLKKKVKKHSLLTKNPSIHSNLESMDGFKIFQNSLFPAPYYFLIKRIILRHVLEHFHLLNILHKLYRDDRLFRLQKHE